VRMRREVVIAEWREVIWPPSSSSISTAKPVGTYPDLCEEGQAVRKSRVNPNPERVPGLWVDEKTWSARGRRGAAPRVGRRDLWHVTAKSG
jgi:hypothetical protein